MLDLMLAPRTGRVLLLPTALVALLPTRAHAEGMNAQQFNPVIDGHTFTTVEDSVIGAEGPGGGFVLNYAKDPLVFRFTEADNPEGFEETALLSSLATVDLLGFYNYGRFRFGIDVPVNPVAQGYDLEGSSLWGDIALDAKAQVLDRLSDPIGFSVAVSTTVPSGNEAAWLGTPGMNARIRTSVSTGEEVITTLNLGAQTGRKLVEEGFSLGGPSAGDSA